MGTYYYIKDPEEGGLLSVYEDDYIQALYSIASKHGVKITDKVILEEIKKNWSYNKDKKR